ncbi:lanthionine biosynthesis cyclase LanC [Filimonas lacunae]|nr:lanthionine biosynthesis cyclase LanC [Filimonas lacunae]
MLKSRALHLFEKTDEAILFNGLTHTRTLPDTDIILYYSALYEATVSEEYGSKVDALLADAFATVNEQTIRRMNPGLAKGLSTLLYLADMHEKRGRYVEYGGKRDLIEDYCFQYARHLVASDTNGFLNGSFGILFCFLNTSFYTRKQKHIELLLEDIDAAAVQNLHRFWIRNANGDNRHEIDFSLANGQHAYLLILLQALERGISIDRNYMSITKGINYLLQVKQDVDNESKKYSFFPESVNSVTHQRTYSNRLAWNGGDLNGALLLYNAADTLSNNIYLQVADIVGTSSLMRVKEEETLCTDGSFYYGAAGVAQLYKTLHKLRPLPAYENGYRLWMEKTMDFLEEELQHGTYQSKENDLLNGLVGVNLTLLSFINEKELSWSRICLL